MTNANTAVPAWPTEIDDIAGWTINECRAFLDALNASRPTDVCEDIDTWQGCAAENYDACHDYPTEAEARAFVHGCEFVNDSALEVRYAGCVGGRHVVFATELG